MDHLGLQILRNSKTGPLAHFLGDDSVRVFFEIYRIPVAPVPVYAAHDPSTFHFTLVVPTPTPGPLPQ